MYNKRQLVNWAFVTLREAAWAPLGVICFYAMGLAFDLYDLFPPLDIPSHVLGDAAITYFYRSAIKHSQMVRGLKDTIVDMVLRLMSALVFSLFYWRR